MSKPLGFVIFLFLMLVVGNAFLSAVGSAFQPSNFSYAAEQPIKHVAMIDLAGSGAMPINVSLFTKDGSGTSYITQGYGRTVYAYLYPAGWHDGVDIAAPYGAPVYSPNAGTIIATGNQDNFCYHRGFGKYIAVGDTSNGLVLWYAHLGTVTVVPGQSIIKGALLGDVGATGLETGTHLHFSIFKNDGFTMTPRDGCGPEPTGQDVNPLNYLGTTYN